MASRIAYLLYVGLALRRQERHRHFTRRWGCDAGFRRFKRVASLLMINDAAGFVAACVLGWHTLPDGLPGGVMVASGTVLVIAGIATKLWARATLGGDAYYWSNFFVDSPSVIPTRAGPYRFLENPMYTVGNLHICGFALVTASLPGLIAAAFDQAAIFVFYRLVEKPHFDQYRASSSRR